MNDLKKDRDQEEGMRLALRQSIDSYTRGAKGMIGRP